MGASETVREMIISTKYVMKPKLQLWNSENSHNYTKMTRETKYDSEQHLEGKFPQPDGSKLLPEWNRAPIQGAP